MKEGTVMVRTQAGKTKANTMRCNLLSVQQTRSQAEKLLSAEEKGLKVFKIYAISKSNI